MTIQFTVSDSSGNIVRTGYASTLEQANLQAGPGETVVPVGSDPAVSQVRVADNTVQPRAATPISDTWVIPDRLFVANGSDFIQFNNIPNGAGYSITVP